MALSDNLISYWSLEEASGTRNDAHGSNHLAPTNAPGNMTGKVGNAFVGVAASNQYLSIADNAALSTGDIDFTLACWVNFATTAASQTIISKWIDPSAREYLLFKPSGATTVRWAISSTGSDAVQVNFSIALSTAAWYFVVAWHDAANNVIGISVNNGTPATTAHSGGVFDSASAVAIGGRTDTTSPIDGGVDEAAFWRGRVLTSGERTDLYNSGAGRDYAYIGGAAATGQPMALRRSQLVTGAQRFGRGF